MQIDELEVGTPLSFLVDIKGSQMCFESHVISVNDNRHFILAEGVFNENKIVSFKGEDITASLLAICPGDRPMIFVNPTILTLRRNDNTLCYKILTNKAGRPFNRRGAYRCIIGIDSTVSYGLGAPPAEVFIRDVSVSGFSISCDGSLKIRKNQLIHVVLSDVLEGNNRKEEFNFTMFGVVVRVQEHENGRKTIGCRFNDPVKGLDTYIAKKDRLAIAKSNQL